jgi:hypothetical protein
MPYGGHDWLALTQEPTLEPEIPIRSLVVGGRMQSPTVHPAAGMWGDREDIGDTVTFVSQLRQHLEA